MIRNLPPIQEAQEIKAGSIPGSGRIPRERNSAHSSILPGKFHGQRNTKHLFSNWSKRLLGVQWCRRNSKIKGKVWHILQAIHFRWKFWKRKLLKNIQTKRYKWKKKNYNKKCIQEISECLEFFIVLWDHFFRAFILSQPLRLFLALLSLCIAIGLASTEKISSVCVVLELLFPWWPNDLHELNGRYRFLKLWNPWLISH